MSDSSSVFCDFEGTDFLDFSQHMPDGSPPTPGVLTPDISFERKFFDSFKITMPDGVEVDFWGFEDERGVRQVPSTQIRVTEGQVVHVRMKAGKGVHTIHHHGIEPESFNDGVGHTSFEAGEYTYQWRPFTADAPDSRDPTVGKAGSYVYHCHVNTVLHAQMFLAGTLVVDPKRYDGDLPTPDGTRRPFRNCRFVYGVKPGEEMERYWATMSVDPRWHELDHAAGLDGKDVGLNRFEPKYFLINGVPQAPNLDPRSKTRTDPRVAILNTKLASFPSLTKFYAATPADPQRGILLRLINAHYYPQIVDFGKLDGVIIASDGSPFPTTKRDTQNRPVVDLSATDGRLEVGLEQLPGGRLQMSPFERYDVMVLPTAVGVFPITFMYCNWISGKIVSAAQTVISVS